MSTPQRRRPGSASPIKLTALVEEVRTSPIEPASPAVTSPVAESVAPPAAPIAPIAPVMTPAVEEVPVADVAIENTAVETMAEPAAAEPAPAAALPAGSPVVQSTVQPASPAVAQPIAAPVAPPAEVPESIEKKATTLGLRIGLKKRAETAVLRTGGFEGGYTSLTALVEGAMERELVRLANEFNNGQPFPTNTGTFRQGRPLGS
jgi:hypothetical protein